MLYWLKFIYITFFMPPGIFIVLLLGLGGWLLHKKERGIAFVMLGMAFLLYIVSNYCCSDLLMHSLEYRYRPSARIQGDVIVMLGGGATLHTPNLHHQGHLSGAAANRLLTCIQLEHQLKVPLIVSGGQVFKNTGREAEIAQAILIDTGIPEERIHIENQSLNTTQNAENTALLLAKYHYRHPILVTSAFHMARAVKQFKKAGISVTPFPTDYRTNEKLDFIAVDWVPTSEALDNFSIALKEYYGLLAAKWY
ncbi:MAG TPA: YdcF family protein [Firmicutes bacterium]|jgi:uncharacterized SAM-binding protein YcdF (DUF218 family)|nr:YdcF family protein [Bacillota bacterium]